MPPRPCEPPRFTRRYLMGGLAGTAFAWTTTSGQRSPGASPPEELHAPQPEDLGTRSMAELVTLVRDPEDIEHGTAALVEVFARSGIAVFDPDLSAPLAPLTGPISPLSLLRSQVTSMTEELALGSGRPAGEFDTLFPVDSVDGAEVPPVSDLYAGYAAAAQTSGAEFARQLMTVLPDGDGEIPAAALPAPTAAIGLMTGEILGQLQNELPELPEIPGVPSIPSLPGLPDLPPLDRVYELPPLPELDGSACSNVQRFVTTVIQRVLSVLEAGKSVTTIPILKQITDGAARVIRFGLSVIVKVIDVVISPVMGLLKAIAAGVAIASALIGTLSTWKVSVRAVPNRNRLGVGALEYLFGDINIDAGGADQLEWPKIVTDCAGVANLTLPKRTSAGAPVRVDVRQPPVRNLVILGQEPRILDEHGRLVVTYQTDNETEQQAQGREEIGIVYITATVERDDLHRMTDALLQLLLAEVPTLIANVLEPIIGPVVREFKQRVLELTQAHGHDLLFVTYHANPEPTPVPGGGGCVPGLLRARDATDLVLGGQQVPAGGEASSTGDWIWDFKGDDTLVMSPEGVVVTYAEQGVTFTYTWRGLATGRYTVAGADLTIAWESSNIEVTTRQGDLEVSGPEWGLDVLNGDLSAWQLTCGTPIILAHPSGSLVLEFDHLG